MKDFKYIESYDLLLMLFAYPETKPIRLYNLSYFMDNFIFSVKKIIITIINNFVLKNVNET